MLLSLTPNPAVDKTMLVPRFRNAEVARATEIHEAAGGKGLNVVRAARALGGRARACAPLGGAAGRRVAALAEAEGLDARWSWLRSGETRTCTLVVDADAPDTLVLNENGPRVTPEDWAALAALVRVEAARAELFASSGSLPPGVLVGSFVDLLADIMAAGTPTMLDTSGATLAAALDLPLLLLKVNGHELGDALGLAVTNPEQAYVAAEQARRRGPRQVIVTLGADGAVAAGSDGGWHARPPSVRPISPVGSGDAVLAGVAVALMAGQSLDAALRLGVACGTANTLTIGGGAIRPDDVARLQQATTVERV